jgi:hypothetical protein
MPKRCAVYGCRGNYRGQPYSQVVRFPTEEAERDRWIKAMPNDGSSLTGRRDLYECASHFDCEWVVSRGGRRPTDPPSIFPGVAKSCLKQSQPKKRTTLLTSSAARQREEIQRQMQENNMTNFETFIQQLPKRYPHFIINNDGDEVYMTLLNDTASKVIQFLWFRKVESPFGFLYVVRVEKDSYEIPKHNFTLNKNSRLNTWSQLSDIFDVINKHAADNFDRLNKVLEELNSMEDLHASSHFQFLLAQLEMLLMPPNKLRYTKYSLIFAAELLCVSPAAYRMLRGSRTVILPKQQLIRELMSRSVNDSNLQTSFNELKPEQRLVNILFDEVKLKSVLRFTAGHVVGHAENQPDILATSALAFELVCHYGGPRFTIRVVPVAKLDATKLKEYLLEVITTVKRSGGLPVSIVCDNCPLNQRVYKDLGGPGLVQVPNDTLKIYLVHDYVHIYKNIRNNWITEPQQELSFQLGGAEYKACWSDIRHLYEADSKTPLRMTKLTHTAVFPKVLQRQSVPLVCKVFDDKTVAAFEAVKDSLEFQSGTVKFVKLITRWFKMMNVKDRYSYIKLRDNCREPWKLDCENFKQLESICNVVSTCKWEGTGKRCRKLTKFTADAFVLTTKFNIAAATDLLSKHHFKYVLPAVFSQDPLEKFFGQARQRFGGNFYIDISDVIAASKVQRLHQLLKLDIIPKNDAKRTCACCTATPDELDLEILQDLTADDTVNLIQSDDCLKHKVIFIAGFLTRKYDKHISSDDANDAQEITVSSDFTRHLDRGGLSLPKLSTVYFVHSAVHIISKLIQPKASCRKFVATLLSYVDAPIANNNLACRTVINVLLKAHVIHHSDREQELGCLRRREKLQ